MSDFIAKVLITDVGVTKALRFNVDQTVHECTQIAKERANIPLDKQYIMFSPANKRMMMADKRIGSYGLENNELVELRQRNAAVKIKLVDGTTKTIMLDCVQPVGSLTQFIGEKLGIKLTDEFALQKDENKEWLEVDRSLMEQIEAGTILALKKRYFLNDAIIDQSDPMQLHLIFAECQGNVLNGSMPVEKDAALQLAALQLQIEKGDHKKYFETAESQTAPLTVTHAIPENMRAKIDAHFTKCVISEWSHLAGVTDVQSKYRYIQLIRSLPTFGITIWKIREKVQGKSKPLERLLGLTKSSIVRMELDKSIFQTYSLRQIKRWAAGEGCITLDFGNHFSEYYTAFTSEGEIIAQTLGGYVDLLLKKQKESAIQIDENVEKIAEVDEISSAMAVSAAAQKKKLGIKAGDTPAQVMSLSDARRQVERTLIAYKSSAPVMSSEMSMFDVERLLVEKAQALRLTVEDLISPDVAKQQAALKLIAPQTSQLHDAYGAAFANGLAAGILNTAVGEDNLLHACRSATDAVMKFLTSESAIQALRAAQKGISTMDTLTPELFLARSALVAVQAQAQAKTANNQDAQKLLHEFAKNISTAVNEMVEASKLIPSSKAGTDAMKYLETIGNQALAVMKLIAPTTQSQEAQQILEELSSAMRGAIVSVLDAAKASGLSETSEGMTQLWGKAQTVQEAIEQLLKASRMPGTECSEHAVELASQTQELCTDLAIIIDPTSDAKKIAEKLGDVKNSVASMVRTGKTIAMSDPSLKEPIIAAVLKLVEATKNLEGFSKKGHGQELDRAIDGVRQAIEGVLSASGYVSMAQGMKGIVLGSAAKAALAGTLALQSQVKLAAKAMKNNPKALADLLQASSEIPKTIETLLGVLSLPPDEMEKVLLTSVNKFAPEAFRLVAAAKTSVPTIQDSKRKAAVVHASDVSAGAIRNLIHQAKIFQPRGKATVAELVAVKDDLQKMATDLVQTLNAAKAGQLELFTVGVEQIRENAFKTLNVYGRAISASSTKLQFLEFEEFPQEIDNLLKLVKKVIGVVKGLAGTTENKELQTALLTAAMKVMQQVALLLASASKNDKPDLEKKGLAMEETLKNLVEAGRGIIIYELEQLQSQQSVVVQDVAERELMGAASVIQDALKKIVAAQERARQQASSSGVKLEDGINDSILEYAKVVVQNASELIVTATDAQREINGRNPQGNSQVRAVYNRDPKWEQGLISAAKAVAGSVQYLVRSANDHISGTESASALVATAHTVAANAAQLTTSSRVKLSGESVMVTRLQTTTSKVNASTNDLVRVAAQVDNEISRIETGLQVTYTQFKIKQMEAQLRIKTLEKELEVARNDLAKIRKERYSDATQPAPPPGAAPPRRAGPPPANMNQNQNTPQRMPPPSANPSPMGMGRASPMIPPPNANNTAIRPPPAQNMGGLNQNQAASTSGGNIQRLPPPAVNTGMNRPPPPSMGIQQRPPPPATGNAIPPPAVGARPGPPPAGRGVVRPTLPPPGADM